MTGTKHNGKPRGIHARSWLCALALGGFSITGHTAYANAQPPAGWSAGTGAGATYRAAANESWLSSTVRTNASLNVGGKAVQVPATMRLAANAPRFAARFLYGNPLIALASVAAYAWLQTEDVVYDEGDDRWERGVPGPTTTGTVWSVTGTYNGQNSTRVTITDVATPQIACTQFAAGLGAYDYRAPWTGTYANGGCQMRGANNQSLGNYGNPTSRTAQIQGEKQYVPIGDTEFEELMAPKPLPEAVPNELPIPWPVELPKLNPIPSPDGQPSPLRIPTGDPYPVPNSNPQRYERPVTDIVPSPTPSEPWRMDVQPRVIETPSLDPNVLPAPNPATDPAPEKAPEEQPDLCEKNPDILACSKPELDTPEVETPKRSFMLTYAAENLFVAGSCPANKTMTLRGQQLTVWDFQRTCDLLSTYLKPMIILLATFVAFTILSPGKME